MTRLGTSSSLNQEASSSSWPQVWAAGVLALAGVALLELAPGASDGSIGGDVASVLQARAEPVVFVVFVLVVVVACRFLSVM